MSLDVASNYAASFRPQGPILEGFNTALSTSSSDLLSAIPAQNAAMDMALAQAVVPQVAANARQRLTTDADLKLAADNRRASRRNSALAMLSSILGGGGNQQVTSMGRIDPLANLTTMGSFLDGERARRAQRATGSRGMLGSALQQLFG